MWYLVRKKFKRVWSDQVKLDSSATIQKFGLEIGMAHVLVKLGAKVQLTNGQWYTRKDVVKGSLPVDNMRGHFIVAIDAKETDLDHYSISDIVKLSQVKYLSLDGCSLIDDHCLASLVHLRDTLTHLSVNNCPELTENGIGTLHKLRNLERLNMNDVPNVKHAPLVAVMLEDVLPRLRISLVSKQVEKFVADARRGMDIIEEHRRKAGLDKKGSGQDGCRDVLQKFQGEDDGSRIEESNVGREGPGKDALAKR